MLVPMLTPSESLTPTQPNKYSLLSPSLHRTDGTGPVVDLGTQHAELLVPSICVNHVIENETLTVSIWGSADGIDFGEKPLASFPPKSYCGLYTTFLNLASHPHVRYLRVQWKMARYGRGRWDPVFGFSVSMQGVTAAAA